MRKYLLILLACFCLIPAAFAQTSDDKAKMRADLEKFKLDFVAKEMGLSEKEKADFAPIYKEYSAARKTANEEAFKFERKIKRNPNATPEDYKELSELQHKAREKDNEIVKAYDLKFESILNAKQIYRMHKAEERFFEKMKEMRKKHSDHSIGKNSKGKPSDVKPNRGKPCPNDCPTPTTETSEI